jgi:hypothetical protein
MTATVPSADLIPAGPVFTEPERLALAGFLASYTGLTPGGVHARITPVRRSVPDRDRFRPPGMVALSDPKLPPTSRAGSPCWMAPRSAA